MTQFFLIHSSLVLSSFPPFDLQSLNIVLRMATIMQDLPFNSRSVFTPNGAKGIGGGFELWRGYFQSLRPALGRMIVNIDISTGLMFKGGPLIPLCLEVLGFPLDDPRALLRMNDSQHRRLQQFFVGIRVRMEHSGRTETVKRLSKESARQRTFTLRDGKTKMSVEKYFQSSRNKKLQYPDLICVEVRILCFYLIITPVYLQAGWQRSLPPSRSLRSPPRPAGEETNSPEESE